MPEKEPLTFRPAPEVEEKANALISMYHGHLRGVRITYLFRSEPEVIGGRAALGTARKVTGLNAFLAGPDNLETLNDIEPEAFFVIQVFEDGWRSLTTSQQVALVDHELMHCSVSDEGKLSILPHDLEEFVDIVKRHGLWIDDVDKFVREAVKRMQPDLGVGAEENREAVTNAASQRIAKDFVKGMRKAGAKSVSLQVGAGEKVTVDLSANARAGE